MNADWQFVLNETSVEVLLACKARQRELLLKALSELASDLCSLPSAADICSMLNVEC